MKNPLVATSWALFLTILIPVPAGAGYPPRVQTILSREIVQDREQRLKKAIHELNRSAPRSGGWEKDAEKAGFSPVQIRELRPRMKLDRFASVRLENGRAVVREGSVSAEIESLGSEAPTILIRGKEFKWDRERSVSENLKHYDSLWTESTSARKFPIPALVESAHAEDRAFAIKIAGATAMTLYFKIIAVGEKGGELYRLNERVKLLTQSCLHEPPAGQPDPLMKAVGEATMDAARITDPIRLTECGDVREYAKQSVATLMGEAVYPKVPADLCRNIDALAKCMMENLTDGRMHSEGKKKITDPQAWKPAGVPSPNAPNSSKAGETD